MPKQSRPKKSEVMPREFYSLQPWRYRIDSDSTQIIAYVEASGEWETILTVHQTSGDGAESVAAYVLEIINHHQSKSKLLHDAITALQAVLDEGLNYSTEQAADRVLASIKKLVTDADR